MTDIYQEIVEIKKRGEDAALVTIIAAGGSTPREEGAKMLVRADGSIAGTIGGGNLEKTAIKEALKTILSGKTKHLEYKLQAGQELGMICGGDVELFIEPVISPPSLYICGGGHIGLVLAKIGKLLGFRIFVIDNRPEYASRERFPEAEQTYIQEYKDAFTGMELSKSSFIVIVTHGHSGDEASLERALTTPAGYIGMIGSKVKVKAVYDKLRGRGITEQQIERIYSPVGLKISAQTPEEIAISIFAEIIAVRRGDTDAVHFRQ